MTCLTTLNGPQYDAPDPAYDEAKARFLVRRAQELLSQEMTYADALREALKEE